MKTRTPIVAVWVLENLTADVNTEMFVGDVIEQYNHGRSQWWVWKQTLAAVIHDVVRDLRSHSALAIRATLAALVLLYMSGYVFNLGGWAVARAVSAGITIGTGERSALCALCNLFQLGLFGWAIGRWHASHPGAVLPSLAIALAVLRFSDGLRLASNFFEHSRYQSYFWNWIASTTSIGMSYFAGAVAGVYQGRRAQD